MKARVFFEAEGRRAASMGIPMLCGVSLRRRWPLFAQRAWARGYLLQANYRLGKP